MYKHEYIGIFSVYGDIVAEETSLYFWIKEVTWKVSVTQYHFRRRAGWCLFTPLDLLSTLAPPALCPGADFDGRCGRSIILSASPCVQPRQALAGDWRTWRAGEGEVGMSMCPQFLPFSRRSTSCQAVLSQSLGFSYFVRVSATALCPSPLWG